MARPKDIVIQANVARQALASLDGATVSAAPVGGRQGLEIYVAPGQRSRAIRMLGSAGVRVPVDVKERFQSNPGLLDSVAARLGLGRPNGSRGIHPPPNPSPDVLPANIREFWDQVYRQAFQYYKSAKAPEPAKVADRTAWRAVRLSGFREKLDPRWLAGHPVPDLETIEQRLPDPGDTITLGKLLEYSWLDGNANLVVGRWLENPPDMHWNPDTKCIFAFPSLPDATTCEPIPADMQAVADEFERFHQRKAECVHNFHPEAVGIFVVGPGDGLAYRSDKWHIKNSHPSLQGSGEFFHQFSDGVWIWQDRDDQPTVLMICGGDLDVEERGIVH